MAVPEGVTCCREEWMDQICVDAESLKPDIPRRGEGNAAALQRRKNGSDSVQPARIWKIDT
ncbi:hypothetical protein STZ1_10420 [Bacillus subtilis]